MTEQDKHIKDGADGASSAIITFSNQRSYTIAVVRMAAGALLAFCGTAFWPIIAESILGVSMVKVAPACRVVSVVLLIAGVMIIVREWSAHTLRIERIRLAIRLVVFFFAAIVGMVFLEGLLRLVAPVRATATVWTPAAIECGWALPPSFCGVEFSLETGRRVPFRTNSAGWRDIEFNAARQPAVFRVVILGDSQVQGYGLAFEDTIAFRLREALSRRGYGSEVEILQAGCEGWGTDQELLALESRILPLKPDLALLSFTLENDPVDNLYSQHIYGLERKPVFRQGEDGELVYVPAPRRPGSPLLGPFLGGLQIVKRLRILLRGVLYRIQPLDESGLPPSHLDSRFPDPAVRPRVPDYGGRHVDLLRDRSGYSPFSVPESPRMAYAWDVTRMLLRRMHKACGGAGSRFIVMEPRGMLYAGSPPMDITQGGVPIRLDFQAGMRRLSKICQEEGVPLLLPPLVEKGCFHADGHLLPKGNRILAEYLADWLISQHWFPRPRQPGLSNG